MSRWVGCAVMVVAAIAWLTSAGTVSAAVPKLPKDFLWGVGSSAFQTEGHTTHSNWNAYIDRDSKPGAESPKEPYGNSVDFRSRYRSDIDLAAGLGVNTYRISINWTRVEPRPGVFSAKGLRYYGNVVDAMKAKGIDPLITLNHWDYPSWVADQGAWTNAKTVGDFKAMTQKIVDRLGSRVHLWLTFNEEFFFEYVEKSNRSLDPQQILQMRANLIAAHRRAYNVIHRGSPRAMVSSNFAWPGNGSLASFETDPFINAVADKLDYLALDYYYPAYDQAKTLIALSAGRPYDIPLDPFGMFTALRQVHSRYPKLPILITENGMPTKDGSRDDGVSRRSNLTDTLYWVQRARAAGVPVFGYLYWALTDSYEWGSYTPRFGLYRVDVRTDPTLKRRPTGAVKTYRALIRNRGVRSGYRLRARPQPSNCETTAVAPADRGVCQAAVLPPQVAEAEQVLRALRTARRDVRRGQPYEAKPERYRNRSVWAIKVASGQGRPYKLYVRADGRKVVQERRGRFGDATRKALNARVGMRQAVDKAARHARGRFSGAKISRRNGRIVWLVNFERGRYGTAVTVDSRSGTVLRSHEELVRPKSCQEPGRRWERAKPSEVGMSASRLQEAVNFAIADKALAFRVYRHGCLVAENSEAPEGTSLRTQSWSMAKGVSSVAFGRAWKLGLIGPDDPVGSLLPEADAAHGAIRLRDLLSMTAGNVQPVGHDFDISLPDRVRDALTVPLIHPPGEFFNYWQSSPPLLDEAVERAAGEDFQSFLQRQVLSPIGIGAGKWSWDRDAAGNTLGFMGLRMTPDDYGRLGDLMRRNGVWRGKRLLSPEYMRNAVKPSTPNGCYAWYFWVHASPQCNGGSPEGNMLGLDPKLFEFNGLSQQLITVFPGTDIVMVRVGSSGGHTKSLYEHTLAAVTDQDVPLETVPPDPDRPPIRQTPASPGTGPGELPELPAAGPARARAVIVEPRPDRVDAKGHVDVVVNCPPRLPAVRRCRGTARLEGARGARSFLLRAGQRRQLRFRLTDVSLRRLIRSRTRTAILAATTRDATATGTVALEPVVLKAAPRRRPPRDGS